MNVIILIIKGFIIGIGKIIPGVSGAMLAISMGLYEKCLNAITYFFKNIKENIRLLCPVGIGVLLAIVLGSKMIAFFLAKYYLFTMLLFVGLILGGMINLIKRVKNYKLTNNKKISFIICFLIVIFLAFIKIDNQYLLYPNLKTGIYFLMGIIDAATMIIPGISGTAIFMLLGMYQMSIALFASLTSLNSIIINLELLIPFLVGLIIGGIGISILMTFLLKKHEETTYYGILGFQLSAIVIIVIEIFKNNYNFMELIIALILFVIGIFIGKKLD